MSSLKLPHRVRRRVGSFDHIDRSEAQRAVARLIETIEGGRSSCLVIEAPPGYGRTHMLAWSTELALGRGPRVSHVEGGRFDSPIPFHTLEAMGILDGGDDRTPTGRDDHTTGVSADSVLTAEDNAEQAVAAAPGLPLFSRLGVEPGISPVSDPFEPGRFDP
ncbi:MAG TPA: hypothetical protein ENI86_04605 [Acidimicrobiales bacterium]|nr:hypothetical protein [Acidimicrobiales bacterium]